MKTLLLFRHAKSDWDAGFDHDHERPLAKRGRKAARRMGRLLAEAGQVPDSSITSSAVRAQATLELAREAGGWKSRARVTQALYAAAPEQVLVEIQAEPDATHTLMLVGHEPTWSDLTSRLIGGGAVKMPTAAIARVDLDIDRWAEAGFDTGELIWLLIPRLFVE